MSGLMLDQSLVQQLLEQLVWNKSITDMFTRELGDMAY